MSRRNWIGAWTVVSMVVGAGQLAAAQTAATQVGPGTPGRVQQGGGPYACTIGATMLLDNGDTDGSNGYSNATAAVFGSRRTLLDDFVVPAGPGFVLNEFAWRHLWAGGGSLLGTGLEMSLRSDAAGNPGPVILTLTPTGYTEAATGRVWFGRPEMESHSNLGGVTLVPGTYWFEFTVVGPDNNFAMIKDANIGSICWVNYDDLGGLQSCLSQFGATTDITWALCGSIVPVELMQFGVE